MSRTVNVTRAQVRAAQLRVRSDVERGITPDPRMVRIANAGRQYDAGGGNPQVTGRPAVQPYSDGADALRGILIGLAVSSVLWARFVGLPLWLHYGLGVGK